MKKLILGLCGTLLLCGCNGTSMRQDAIGDVRIGQVCKVQFRRDAAGPAESNPNSPPVDALVGVLKARGDNWIVVSNPANDDESSFVIPTQAILFIQVFPKIKPHEAFPKRPPAGAAPASEPAAPPP
jgi:hypothetical protein